MEIKARSYITGEPLTVTVKGDRIAHAETAKPSAAADARDWISPGWIDVQVNGFGGYDLNRFPLQPETVAALTRELWKVGVTRYCPTIITNSHANIAQAVEAIRLAAERDDLVRRSILGIHLEGPYLSEKDGPRGAHNKSHIRNPRIEEFAEWQERAGGLVKLVTIAPEREGALPFIERLKELGIVVAIGHTAAAEDAVTAAVDAGAGMSTHLGNGTELQLHRHRNYVFAQLSDDRLWASVIADGFHLPPSLLEIYYRVKGEKLLLVSDSTAFGGMAPGTYTSEIGGEVTLDPSGRLYVKHTPDILAGSALPMVSGIENMVKFGICSFREAIEMACIRPARAMGVPEPGLQAGEAADLVVFGWDEGECRLQVKRTIVGGSAVYEEGTLP